MGRGSLNFATPESAPAGREPLGLGQFTFYALCFGALAALATLFLEGRLVI
jgi:hypothetical protein